ncbi:MAG: FlgD immunoglobulin-like domain containing protein [Candidatus Krumholzibacteriota bacterium]
MTTHKTFCLVIGIAITVLFAPTAMAAWPTGETTIATNTSQYLQAGVIDDETGGAILTWFSSNILMAQRFAPDGTMLWTAGGADVGDLTNAWLYGRSVVADGSGGFIYAFRRDNDIYAQHVDSTGAADWDHLGYGFPNPVPVCTNPANQYHQSMDTDGAGGVIIAWTDYRDGNMIIHAQHIDATGTPQWTLDGVPLGTTALSHIYPLVLADGYGGAFVSCNAYVSGGWSYVYCQHVDATGTTTWGPDGIQVSETHAGSIPTATNDHNWNLLSDGAGGILSTWRHTPYTNQVSIQASRLTAAGARVWADSVVALTPALPSEIIAGSTTSAATGDGGLVSGWSEPRNFAVSGYDLFINRLDGAGNLVWSASTAGIPLCTETNNQNTLALSVDPAGVTWATWKDGRSGSWQLYSQHIDAGGTALGAVDGDAFDLNRDPVTSGPVQVSGGVFVAYSDKRNPAPDITTNLYAKVLGGPVSAVGPVFASDLTLSPNWPNPFSSETRIGYATGRPGFIDLSVYDLRGRRVRTLFGDAVDSGDHVARWDGRDRQGNPLAAGVYFVRLRSGGEIVSRRMTLLR